MKPRRKSSRPRLHPPPSDVRPLSPVLLVGAGTGEATCGILYLASHLRRNGVEAFVRLYDDDGSEEETARTVAELLRRVRPRLVGISLKWFHHLARARLLAETVKALDPEVKIVFGGNTAAYYWRELSQWECVDEIVLGDGEAPLLALCRGEPSPPNVVTRTASGAPSRLPLKYVQGPSSSDIYYSHFDELFLSQLDLHRFSGWVAPGKGCGENCLYCGGTRGVQEASFGRSRAFLRPIEAVQRDHREVVPRTWQLRYDFSGSSAEFLARVWEGSDLSKHSTTYFLWGIPPRDLIGTLAGAFRRVFLVLDIGCFSETQRLEQQRRGLLKPCPTDVQLFQVIDDCARYPNLQLEVSGIAGLPFVTRATLEEERRLVDRVLGRGCAIGYQRLEAQPGALATEHSARFGMRAEARTFNEFLEYFTRRGPADVGAVPMVRHGDAQLERAVQVTFEEIDQRVREQAASARHIVLDARTLMVDASASRFNAHLGDWLGVHRVPARVAREKVTVVRAMDGQGLACAPTLSPKQFADRSLQQGDEGRCLLAALDAFATPTRVDTAVARLTKATRLDAESAWEVIEHLTAAGFLLPA